MYNHHNIWNTWRAQVQDPVCYDEIKNYNKNFLKRLLTSFSELLQSEQKLKNDQS